MRWNRTITVVDCHAEGESGQVVVGGVPPIPGETVFDKRVYLQDHADDLPAYAAGHVRQRRRHQLLAHSLHPQCFLRHRHTLSRDCLTIMLSYKLSCTLGCSSSQSQ